MKHEIEISTADFLPERDIGAATSSGHVELEVTRAGLVSSLKTDWVIFGYSENDKYAKGGIQALFGENTGQNVPSVFFTIKRRLGVGKYPIQDRGEVTAMYGFGGPGAIGGDAFGEGELVVDEFSYSPTSKSIRGSFDFDYIDSYGVEVNVKCMAFWAKNIG